MENKSDSKAFHKKQTLTKVLFSFIFLLCSYNSYSIANQTVFPVLGYPMEIDVTLHINKIYNINTVDETYQVDGYLEYYWVDSTLKDDLTGIYENGQVDEIIGSKLWFPAIELINIQGEKQVANKSLEINLGGKVNYSERFFGVFDTPMDFKKFPFDDQQFNVVIEPYSYDTSLFVFVHSNIILSDLDRIFTEEWEMLGEPEARITTHDYIEDNNKQYYSRAVFVINAKRLIGYYLWEVLLPLLIIIFASFVIFWIKDFGTQIGIGFTLMLTVVAFNFYSASILPKLPYQTFIETIIFIGYVFIFMGILAVTLNYRMYGNKNNPKFNKLINILRYVFPVGFIALLILIFVIYGII